MPTGYGFSHVHEPKPRKKIYNRVASASPSLPQVDQHLVHTMLTQAMRHDTDAFIDKALSSSRKGKTHG